MLARRFLLCGSAAERTEVDRNRYGLSFCSTVAGFAARNSKLNIQDADHRFADDGQASALTSRFDVIACRFFEVFRQSGFGLFYAFAIHAAPASSASSRPPRAEVRSSNN